MPDNANTPPVTPPAPKIEDDIISDLFSDPPTPPAPPVDNKVDNKVDNPPPDDKGDKVDVEAIVNQAVTRAVEQIKPLINQSANNLTRQQQLNTWFGSDDGKMFIQYKQFIEKAANDPRFIALRIEQLPGVVLKQSAYAKVLSDTRAAADRAAADGRTGGTSGRPYISEEDKKAPDYKNMSREEFLKIANENNKKMIQKRR